MERKILSMLAAGVLLCLSATITVRAAEIGSIEPETVFADERYYETGLSGVTMQGTGVLFYEVVSQGSGQGAMEISGNATGDFEVVVKIVKSGVIGEAEYQISLDGGLSYIGQDVVADRCRIADAGLTLHFSTGQDNVEFALGDTYCASVPETFPVTASRAGEANVVATGHPLKDHEITVEILSSGGPGVSKFTVSTPDQRAAADVIPADGMYELQDDLWLVFSASAGYERGQNYFITVSSNHKAINYIPFYILIAAFAFAGILGYLVLIGKKEKPGDYRLRYYKGRGERRE